MESYRPFQKRDDKFKSYYPDSSTQRMNFNPQRDQNREIRKDNFPEDRVQRNTNFPSYNRGSNFQRREGYDSGNRAGYSSQSRQNFASGTKRNYPFQETYDHDLRSSKENSNDYSSLSKYDSFNKGRPNTEALRDQDNDSLSKTSKSFPSQYDNWKDYKEAQKRQDYSSQSRQIYSSTAQDYLPSSSGQSFNRRNLQDSSPQFGSSKEQDFIGERRRDFSRVDGNYQRQPELGLPQNYGYRSQQDLRFQSLQDTSPQNKLELASSKGPDLCFERRQDFSRRNDNSQSGPYRGLPQNYGYQRRQDLISQEGPNLSYQSQQDLRSMQGRSQHSETDFGSSKGLEFIFERRQDFNRRDGNSQSGPERGLSQNYTYQRRQDLRSQEGPNFSYQNQQDVRPQGAQDYHMKKGYDSVSRKQESELSAKQNVINNPKELGTVYGEPAAKHFKGDFKSEESKQNYCKTCELSFVKTEEYEAHMAAASHKVSAKKGEKLPADSKRRMRSLNLYCNLCDKYLQDCSNDGYYMHCQGNKHKTKLKAAGIPVPLTGIYKNVSKDGPPVGEEYLTKIEGRSTKVAKVKCTLCFCKMPEYEGISHCKGRQHIVMYSMKMEGNPEKSVLKPEDGSGEAALKGDKNSEELPSGDGGYGAIHPEFNSKYRLRGENLVCPLCVIMLKTDMDYVTHIKGEEHKKVLMAAKKAGMPIPNCSLSLALQNAPPIGLEYVEQVEGKPGNNAETTNEDELLFNCTLCNHQFLGKLKNDHCKYNSHRCAYSKLRVQKMEQLEKKTNTDTSSDDPSSKEVNKNDNDDAQNENDKSTANEECQKNNDKLIGNDTSSGGTLKENDENKTHDNECKEISKSMDENKANDPLSEETQKSNENEVNDPSFEEMKDDCENPDVDPSHEERTNDGDKGINNEQLLECEKNCPAGETPQESDLLKERELVEEKEKKLSLGDLHCPLCNLTIRSDFSYQTHVKGRNHKKLKNQNNIKGIPVPDCSLRTVKEIALKKVVPVGEECLKNNDGSSDVWDVKIPSFSCTICGTNYISSNEVAGHCKSSKHRCAYATYLRLKRERIDHLLNKDVRKPNKRFNRNVPTNFGSISKEEINKNQNDPSSEADLNKNQNVSSKEAAVKDSTKELQEDSALKNSEKPPIQTDRNIRCNVCNIDCPDEFAYSTHIRSGRHREEVAYQRIYLKKSFSKKELKAEKKEAQKKIMPIGDEYVKLITPERVSDKGKVQPAVIYCEICDCKFGIKEKMSHLKGARHRWSYKEKVDPNFPLVDMHERRIPWTKFLKEKREEHKKSKLNEASSSN